jgi:hypothetical protein
MNPDGIPSEKIETQLRRHIAAGRSPEDATVAVLAPYGDTPLPQWARNGVLQTARGLYRRRNRSIEDSGFRPSAGDDARLRLARTEFTLPDGTRLQWEKLTLAELELKASWLRTQIDSLSVDLERIERAIDLLTGQPEGTRLCDVEDWQGAVADPGIERSGGDDDPGDLSQAA